MPGLNSIFVRFTPCNIVKSFVISCQCGNNHMIWPTLMNPDYLCRRGTGLCWAFFESPLFFNLFLGGRPLDKKSFLVCWYWWNRRFHWALWFVWVSTGLGRSFFIRGLLISWCHCNDTDKAMISLRYGIHCLSWALSVGCCCNTCH